MDSDSLHATRVDEHNSNHSALPPQALPLGETGKKGKGFISSTPMPAPIHRLPLELLGIIFKHCVIPISPPAALSQIRPSSAPLLLTRVCRSWRAFTFATSNLWTVIDIGEVVIRSRRLPTIIACWIENSGRLPLSIRVVCSAGGILRHLLQPILDGEEYLGVMRLIRKELYRCKMLVLCSLERHSNPIAHLIPRNTCMPRLEELVVDYFSDTADAIVLDTPNLRRVNLMCKIAPCQVSTMLPTSRSIFSLQIGCHTMLSREFLHFTKFYQLDSLVCFINTLEISPDDSNITLQSLTILKLTCAKRVGSIISFLSHLHLPSLRQLRLITGNVWTMTEDGEDIWDLTMANLDLSRLQVLDLDVDMTRSPLVLTHMTALERLLISDRCPGLVSTLSSLAKPLADGSWLCPKLQVLEIFSLDPKSLEASLKLIRARGLEPNSGRVLPLPLRVCTVRSPQFRSDPE